MQRVITIAVDFDGTIVHNRYPAIGKPVMFAIETLKALQKEGHQLILWTYRTGPELQAAVDYCKSKGIDFYAVNRSYPEEVYNDSLSRKIQADIFIDDRNIGGLKGWGEVYHLLSEANSSKSSAKKYRHKKSKKGLLAFFKKLV